MALITNKQQDLIDEVISNYLKNYDKIALQYLKFRQDIYELTTSISNEITQSEGSNVSELNKFKIQQLQYDLDKISESYKVHLKNLNLNLDINLNIPPKYIDKLNNQYDSLLSRKTILEGEIDNLKNVQKPLLDKMRLLLKSFESGLNSRTAKKMNRLINDGLNSEPDENSKEINVQSLIFYSDDIKLLFSGTDSKEFTKLGESDEGKSEDASQTTTIARYVDEHLKNGKTFHLLEENKYIYDVSKSAPVDTATSLTSVDEYDKMIENLITNIKDVIEHGAEAKERWSNNARKLDIIKETLNSLDDISDEEMQP